MQTIKSDAVLESSHTLENLIPNIATLLKRNSVRFKNHPVFFCLINNEYKGINWDTFYNHIVSIATYLKKIGFKKGDKMVLYSPNCLEMLELELAVMSLGGIAVPIFAFFKKETADLLIRFCDAQFIAIHSWHQWENFSDHAAIKKIIIVDQVIYYKEKDYNSKVISFYDLLINHDPTGDALLNFEIDPNEICLNMFTSGTMGTPKCVQLSHKNILSQQAALDKVWNLGTDDRVLSYLPWHHSFGGIFELFNSLYRGVIIFLEPSLGKEIHSILENWKRVKPTIFFSVPQTYQSIFNLIHEKKESETVFFHPELKFVFTAAAPLPEILSNEFAKRNVAVYEGWGLTETSPCCTLTKPALKREPGLVGFPIAGVKLKINEENEILVKGPNVMKGYYNYDNANKNAFTNDGWFKTGDIGELTENGLKLIVRKDRIFKLSNGEKVVPTEMEAIIQKSCHNISFALVEGSGRKYPVALLFPNKAILGKEVENSSITQDCCAPKDLQTFSWCLKNCLAKANTQVKQKFARVKMAMLIDDQLSIDNGTLTPSMKMAPKNVLNMYKAHIEALYGGDEHTTANEVYVIDLSC